MILVGQNKDFGSELLELHKSIVEGQNIIRIIINDLWLTCDLDVHIKQQEAD